MVCSRTIAARLVLAHGRDVRRNHRPTDTPLGSHLPERLGENNIPLVESSRPPPQGRVINVLNDEVRDRGAMQRTPHEPPEEAKGRCVRGVGLDVHWNRNSDCKRSFAERGLFSCNCCTSRPRAREGCSAQPPTGRHSAWESSPRASWRKQHPVGRVEPAAASGSGHQRPERRGARSWRNATYSARTAGRDERTFACASSAWTSIGTGTLIARGLSRSEVCSRAIAARLVLAHGRDIRRNHRPADTPLGSHLPERLGEKQHPVGRVEPAAASGSGHQRPERRGARSWRNATYSARTAGRGQRTFACAASAWTSIGTGTLLVRGLSWRAQETSICTRLNVKALRNVASGSAERVRTLRRNGTSARHRKATDQDERLVDPYREVFCSLPACQTKTPALEGTCKRTGNQNPSSCRCCIQTLPTKGGYFFSSF